MSTTGAPPISVERLDDVTLSPGGGTSECRDTPQHHLVTSSPSRACARRSEGKAPARSEASMVSPCDASTGAGNAAIGRRARAQQEAK